MKEVNRKGQVWVETVIYTLIALAMIGAVMAFALPKIQEIQDKAVIEQSVSVVQDINNVILSVVQGGPGNKRLVEAKIKNGNLNIDPENDRIVFEIESSYVYSEPGVKVNIGSVEVLTDNLGGINLVTLTAAYTHEITYQETNVLKTISESPTSYTISIENKGKDQTSGKTIVDISLV